ncbi:hypothetical protein B0H13DRAFT_2017610 [Mycena leptocephala]|nr:hypothetical protein B0H13DRAFT_2017610 [Mycena leptocephala]
MPPAFSLLLAAFFCPSRCELHASRASISCIQDLIHTTSSSVMLSCHPCHLNVVPSQVPKPRRHQKKAQIIAISGYGRLGCPSLLEREFSNAARSDWIPADRPHSIPILY